MKPLHPDLRKPYGLVICSVGTNVVQASLHVDLPNDAGSLIKAWQTRTDDPEIQDFEVIAAWDAEHHIPGRLKADFGDEDAAWHISGPLWRHLRVKQEYAKRFPDHPGSRIPKD